MRIKKAVPNAGQLFSLRFGFISLHCGLTMSVHLQTLFVRNIVDDAIDTFDRDTVKPMHKANTERLDKIEHVLTQISGAVTFIKWLASLVAVIWVCMQISAAAHGHKL